MEDEKKAHKHEPHDDSAPPPEATDEDENLSVAFNVTADVINIIAEQTTTHEAPRDGHCERKPPEKSKLALWLADWGMLGLTGLIVLATIFNIWVFYCESEDSGAKLDRVALKADAVVQRMETALTQNGEGLKQAFKENRDALKSSETQSRGVVEAMQKQFEITDRAWLRAEAFPNLDPTMAAVLGPPFKVDGKGMGQLARIILVHNVGRSVATDVHIRSKTAVFGLSEWTKNPQAPIEADKQYCDSDEDMILPNGKPRPSYTVFPGVPAKASQVGTFKTTDIPPEPDDAQVKEGVRLALFLIGCVDYRYPSSTQRHETRFVFQVFGDKTHRLPQPKMTVPQELLTFEQYFVGGDFAN